MAPPKLHLSKTPPQSSANGIDPDTVRERLKASNIPLRAGTLTRKDLSNAGFADLNAYVGSGSFASDYAGGIGLNIYGDAHMKTDALLLLAKLHALGGSSCYYLTGNQLFRIVNNGTDELAAIRRVRALFIDWFERDFRGEERPYTLREIIAVEDFLTSRSDHKYATYFGTYCPWLRLRWYSSDFLSSLTGFVLDVKVGK